MLTFLAASFGVANACSSLDVQNNLATHDKGFTSRNITLLASTYSENAIIHVHNQYNGNKATLKGHSGVAEFFNYLWQNLGTKEDFKKHFSVTELVKEENCELCNQDQDEATGPGCISGNVFIVWKAPALGFKSGADTLIMDGSGKTRLQNAVFWHEPKDSPSSDGNVLCPGQPAANYCDCQGDCTGNASWCSCAEAKACCQGAQPVVLCPGQPKENYCDCDGDCTENPSWCSCADAAKASCCGSKNVGAPEWVRKLKF